MLLPATDERLRWHAPLPVAPSPGAVRLERFPPSVYAALSGQIGPLANLRSSSGCAVCLATDSPWIELHLDRLHHHQLLPVGIAAEVQAADRTWWPSESGDLRERSGAMTVRLPTGLERGGRCAPVMVWLPLISTCAIAGIALADAAIVTPWQPPAPRWLAIGDSLCQGFSVQSPLQNWVHRLSRRWDLPACNLGVGGIRIEPEAFAWALSQRRWELVTIALGSNHAWRESDVVIAAERAQTLAELALAGGHGRVVWCLPPYKPCEEGKGPPDFAGVPLDHATGDRVRRVRSALRDCLIGYAPRIQLLDELMPHDHRLLPDGLHPTALGFARYAEALANALAADQPQ